MQKTRVHQSDHFKWSVSTSNSKENTKEKPLKFAEANIELKKNC